MRRLLILILTLPLLASGQASFTPTKEQQTKAYCKVIDEYIKAINKNSKLSFDTLFIGDHEEFPKINLPDRIENKKIIKLRYNKGDKEPQNRKSFILINIIENKLTQYGMEFMIITFHQDYHPQHNSYFDLKYDTAKKEFVLNREARFEYNYPKGK